MKTAKDVLTAMECCMNDSCVTCPYKAPEFCGTEIFTDAFEAFTKLDEENRALRTELAVNGKDEWDIPDQTAKEDAGKPNPMQVPPELIWAVAKVRAFGSIKYAPDNWKTVEKSRIQNAAYRHWLEYVADNKSVDKESGLPSLWHCVCNMAFLIAMEGWEDE